MTSIEPGSERVTEDTEPALLGGRLLRGLYRLREESSDPAQHVPRPVQIDGSVRRNIEGGIAVLIEILPTVILAPRRVARAVSQGKRSARKKKRCNESDVF